jgi:hypothetical protein
LCLLAAANLRCDQHAEFIPLLGTALWEDLTDRKAAIRIFTEWAWVLLAAIASIRVSTLCSGADIRAFLDGDLRAHRVPRAFTAERIDVADVLAALLVGARLVLVCNAATTSLRVAAVETAQILAVLTCNDRTSCVPFACAAEVVDQADGVAAIFIVAPRAFMWDAAGASALAAALRSVTIAIRRCDERAIHAILIPRLLAAEWVDVADRIAALGIRATWASMWNIAAWETGSTATRNLTVADLKSTLDAICVPTNLAAIEEIFIRADGCTAVTTLASRQVVFNEAVPRSQRSAAATTDFLGGKRATDIPTRIAAVRVKAADSFTARRVIAERGGV